MNETQIIDAEVVVEHSNRLSIGKRILLALGMLLVLSAAGGGIWIFGILMFTFSLDGASSSDLPDWLDVFMLVGWPATIVLFAALPPLLTLIGVKWNWIFGSAVGAGALSAGVFMTGVVSVLSAVAH